MHTMNSYFQKRRRGRKGLSRFNKTTDETVSVESKSLQNLKLLSRQRGRSSHARRQVSVATTGKKEERQAAKILQTEPDQVFSHNCYNLVALDDSDSDSDSDSDKEDGAVVVPSEIVELKGAWLAGPPQTAQQSTDGEDDTVELHAVRPLSCWADEVSDDEA